MNKVPHATDPCRSFWWRDLYGLSDIYKGVTTVKAASGDTALFWKDMWSDNLLAESHPRAFSFVREEDSSIRHLLSSESLGQVFHLPLSIEAREEVRELQHITAHIDPGSQEKDVWRCVWGGEGFKSSKYYNHCFSEMKVDDAFCWI